MTKHNADLPVLGAALSEGDIFRDVLDNLGEAVYLVDRQRTIRYWNDACAEISGYRAEDVVGRHCFDDILRHVDDHGRSLCKGPCPLAHTMRDGEPRSNRIWLHHKEGHRVPVAVRTRPIRDDAGRIIGAIELFSDDSDVAANEQRMEELEHLALTDPLTGVPNRRFVEMALASRLSELRRHALSLGVVFADIDHFKAANDTYGHEVGDSVLKMVATTLVTNLRGSDVIGRVGGEEFVLLLQHVDEEGVVEMCDRLRMLVEHGSIDLPGGGSVAVTISMGVTLALPLDNVESALHRADELLYASKSSGRNRVTAAFPEAPARG